MAARILHGDALSRLKTLPSDSVQCVVTSPPYWALRKYDIPDIVFDGDPTCEHEWGEEVVHHQDGGSGGASSRQVRNNGSQESKGATVCAVCGAWRGQLGQEPTPQLFIRHLVDIFREVRRVLRPDGTCWLNIGDCYANADKGGYQCSRVTAEDSLQRSNLSSDFVGAPIRRPQGGLKNKDLVGIPWMLAFALRDDGWYLRAENIWAKGLSFCPSYAGSVMPESVTDRPTRSHEQVFLLTKNERYFYDHEAVKEKGVYPDGTRAAKGSGTREGNRRAPPKQAGHGRRHEGFNERCFAPDEDGYATYDGKRNLRTVWAIGVEAFSEAHFATFAPDLVDPCLRAGTSQEGACASCGAPWERIVEYAPMPAEITAQFEAARQATADDHGREDGFTTRRPNYVRKRLCERWEPTCRCQTTEVVPCVVLDPFAGSGTVGLVTERMGLRFIGIELGASYVAMAERRVGDVVPLFNSPADTL